MDVSIRVQAPPRMGVPSSALVDSLRRVLASSRVALVHVSMTRRTHSRALARRLAVLLFCGVGAAGSFAGCGDHPTQPPPPPPAPGTIQGTVATTTGTPLNEIQVQLLNAVKIVQSSKLTTGSGSYQFSGLTPGDYYLRVSAVLGYAVSPGADTVRAVTVQSGQTAVVSLSFLALTQATDTIPAGHTNTLTLASGVTVSLALPEAAPAIQVTLRDTTLQGLPNNRPVLGPAFRVSYSPVGSGSGSADTLTAVLSLSAPIGLPSLDVVPVMYVRALASDGSVLAEGFVQGLVQAAALKASAGTAQGGPSLAAQQGPSSPSVLVTFQVPVNAGSTVVAVPSGVDYAPCPEGIELSEYSRDTRPLEFRRAIILVHGIQLLHTDCNDVTAFEPEQEMWSTLAAALYADESIKAAYKIYLFKYPTYRGIAENGTALVNKLREVPRLTEPNRLVVVAHSMGGLVSRAAMRNDPAVGSAVERLITLATPHHGTPAARPYEGWYPPAVVNCYENALGRVGYSYWPFTIAQNLFGMLPRAPGRMNLSDESDFIKNLLPFPPNKVIPLGGKATIAEIGGKVSAFDPFDLGRGLVKLACILEKAYGNTTHAGYPGTTLDGHDGAVPVWSALPQELANEPLRQLYPGMDHLEMTGAVQPSGAALVEKIKDLVQRWTASGVVRNATTNAVIAGVRVELWSGANNSTGQPLAAAGTNSSGTYLFSGVSGLFAGTYTIRAKAWGYLDGTSQTLSVVAQTTSTKDLTLVPLATSTSTTPDYPCSAEPTLKSLYNQTAAQMTFINGTNQWISLYWLDYQGLRVPQGSFSPGFGGSYTTFLTHPWIVVGADGTCYGIWLPTSGYRTVTVTPQTPIPATLSASALTATTALLNGAVNPNGLATTAWFEWSADPALTTFSTTPSQSVGSGSTPQAFSSALAALASGTTYYFRVAASNSAGSTRGSVVGFTTSIVFTQLTAGYAQTCGSTSAGPAYCWGFHWFFSSFPPVYDELGLTPTLVEGDVSFVKLAAGGNYTCGLTSAGQAYCWGDGFFGALGDGTTARRLTPTPVLQGGVSFVELAAGQRNACGRTSAGQAYCWGSLVGDSTTTRRLTPTPVLQGGVSFVKLTVGGGHTCALTSAGEMYCWGSGISGALGDGTTTDRLTPTPVLQGGVSFVEFTAGGGITGAGHTCGLTSAGQAYCWGDGIFGALGDGTTTTRLTPTPILQGGVSFVELSAGDSHTCGRTSTGQAYCWGRGGFGALGDGTTTDRLTPTPVLQDGVSFVELSAGWAHTCGRTGAGQAYCWGDNRFYQLGDGTQVSRLVPTPVKSP